MFAGHFGTIYQAFNGCYIGRGTPRTLNLFPDGTVFSAKAQQKIRDGAKGWRYSSALCERHGAAPCPTDADARRAWLRQQLARFARLRHPGNFRYAWRLHPKTELLGTVQPFPKRQTFTLAGTQRSRS